MQNLGLYEASRFSKDGAVLRPCLLELCSVVVVTCHKNEMSLPKLDTTYKTETTPERTGDDTEIYNKKNKRLNETNKGTEESDHTIFRCSIMQIL